ncbi:MAG: bifunctional glutamate N-acetyltransferase/amino-acid acetyltransferase ArgJ [Planctomycetes bacterium]|nr:bifunctional glutamate N-acetyltransferase/amino-acid acetyltransferase ArgJ [Planctomycetota bacterium]
MTATPLPAVDRTLGVTAPRGFRAGAATCGVKASGRPDLAVLAADADVPAAALFTTNRVVGAAVQVSREHLARRRTMRGVVATSGNANTCTGPQGLADAREILAGVARELGCPADALLLAQTGIIGRPMPMDKVRPGIRPACAALAAGPQADAAFVQAIMTTDTRPKQAGVRLDLAGHTVTVAGATKGVGMIEPNMATTLSFLTTDAAVGPDLLHAMLRAAADQTYHCLTVDGHASTSDTLALLASGAAMPGGRPVAEGSAEAAALQAALTAVCADLAYQIAADAEGGTKVIEVLVTGAATDAEARAAARAIANSPLVKCAFFGRDPNWGRIVSAAGAAGISSRPETMRLALGDVVVFEGGVPVAADAQALARVMAGHDIRAHLDLGAGPGQARYLTCDFSYDYVKINAEYTT